MVCAHSSLVGSANVTTRRNRQVRLFAEELSKAGRTPVIERKQRESETSRPDIRALDRGGGDDLFDVTIVHPFRGTDRIRQTMRDPLSIPRHAYNEKLKKHNHLLKDQLGGSIAPIVLTTCGGWEPRSHEYAICLLKETSQRSDTCKRRHTALFFQRHSIRLIGSIAEALTHDPRD